MTPRKPVSLSYAFNMMCRLGYVPDLNDEFRVRGEAVRLIVVDDEVVARTPQGDRPWDTFTRTLRPQG
ncbi:hypothetical protein ROS9278_00310 [Roseomonas sp. CECT 9278]|nr:hypothetical protein ROS9278_00310 [Roseomonas sp. CECT 9278]